MAQVKAVFFLPLRDNDGRDLTGERDEAEDAVYALFDGWTKLGVVQGAYRMADGVKAVDEHEAFAVALEEYRLDDLRDVLRAFKAKTTQETIYLEVQHETDIEFL